MGFKRNISDHLALGYGSKYQLLRMLGWHRNAFNKAISEAANVDDDINWLDFRFNDCEDKELLNFDFIKELKDDWRNYWACGSSGLNWDAIGITKDGTYILVEAKAHVCELKSSSGGSSASKEKNNLVMKALMEENGVKKRVSAWNNDCYQLANRLVALDYLTKKKGYKGKLVYVLFEHGYEFNSYSNKSASKEDWEKAIKEEFEKAGIAGTELEKLVNICIFNCKRKD